MSVEEYSLEFTMLSGYATSLVSNHRDEMSRFVIGVSNFMKEECRITMLHGDMNLSRLMMYAQSTDESKLNRISRNFKRSGPSDQNQPRFNKKAKTQGELIDPKVKLEKGNDSKCGKPTCATCWKKHYGKCLIGTGNCFRKEGKQVPPSVPGEDDVPRKNHFYALRAIGSKPDEDDDVDK
ncbi:uncharacterized protein LOC107016640 [Solanum pennellii]|uniref:Uncharacterized protein LOC107016640 n=1 Tax=Solanum pennellii TaxID=28526 RepID=A0ABM1GKW6_SOLPN|nr:uncharacterized protein LOC107016640 [Solanum pennellii]